MFQTSTGDIDMPGEAASVFSPAWRHDAAVTQTKTTPPRLYEAMFTLTFCRPRPAVAPR